MYWDRDIVAECMIIQNIYGEEEQYVDQPATYGNPIWLDEERRPAFVELGNVSGESHEDELDESQESSWKISVIASIFLRSGTYRSLVQLYKKGVSLVWNRRELPIPLTYFTMASSAKTYNPW